MVLVRMHSKIKQKMHFSRFFFPFSKLIIRFYESWPLHIASIYNIGKHTPCKPRGYDSVIRIMQSWVCLIYNLYKTHGCCIDYIVNTPMIAFFV